MGVYPNNISQEEARKKLGLREDKFIYLFLGQIRDYKGVDVLLDAYSRVRTENTILVIAGVCRDPELRKLLNNSADDSTVWHDGLVSDDVLQNYFNAVDVAVLPFKKLLHLARLCSRFLLAKQLLFLRWEIFQNFHRLSHTFIIQRR